MTFVINMALRELRASWRRLLLFFSCIAIGVASMVSVRSFIEILADTVARQARALNGADVRAETMRPWPPDALELLNRFTSVPAAVDYTDIVETRTMVRAADDAAMRPTTMDLRGVKPNYPLYGDVRLVGGEVYSSAMLANQGVVVTRSLVGRLGLAVGGRLAIGSRTYVIRGVAERFPGNGLNFNPAPRALIGYDELEAAGLTAFGSRVRYSRW